jgi:hypothetical protein
MPDLLKLRPYELLDSIVARYGRRTTYGTATRPAKEEGTEFVQPPGSAQSTEKEWRAIQDETANTYVIEVAI